MPLTELDLLAQVALREDSSRQFKADIHNAESLAAEMAAFANSDGGTIYLGVTDHNTVPGLSTRMWPASINLSAMPPVSWCAAR